jgi:membrane protease YdiL (CAAX protease family)
LLSFAIYPLVTVVTISLGIIAGSADILGLEIKVFLSLAVSAFAGEFIKNIFEEFAWRGYLTPKLIELGINDWLVYIISGLVWALWHSAYYLVFLPDSLF